MDGEWQSRPQHFTVQSELEYARKLGLKIDYNRQSRVSVRAEQLRNMINTGSLGCGTGRNA